MVDGEMTRREILQLIVDARQRQLDRTVEQKEKFPKTVHDNEIDERRIALAQAQDELLILVAGKWMTS